MKKAIGLIALMTILVIGTAYALTCTFDQPTTAGTSDNYVRGAEHNVSITISDYVDENSTTATLSSSLTGCDISGALIFNYTAASGGTDNTTYMNFTVDTTAMRDDTICTFAVVVLNGTNQVDLGCTNVDTTFIADSTQPICTHTQLSRTTYNPKQTWVITGTNANSATIKFGSNAAFAMTETSDIFSYRGQIPESTYEPVRGTTSDGLNSTICDLNYVRIDAKSTIKQVGAAIATSEGGQKAGTGTSTTVIIVIAGLLIWYFYKKK